VAAEGIRADRSMQREPLPLPASEPPLAHRGAGATPALRLLVITSLVPTRRRPDFGIFNARDMRLLSRLGVDVRVVVPRLWLPGPLRRLSRFPELCDPDVILPDGVRARLAWYLHPPGRAFAALEWRAKLPSARRVAARWHAAEPCDVLLGTDMTADAVVAVHLGAALGLPAATLAIGSDVMLRPQRHAGLETLLADTLARSDLPLAVSEAMCGMLAATNACRRPPLVFYRGRESPPPPTPAERAALRAALGIGANDCVGVYVGRLTDEKGMPELAVAIRPLLTTRPALRLLLVGAGPHEAAWRELAGNTGGHGRIMLAGLVPPEAVRPHLAVADFMVFPSRSEGLPQAVIEAMDCGLPVVGTRVGGIPEAVVDGVNGLLVPPRDAAALGAALTRMIDDQELRTRCAAASLVRARTVFAPERSSRTLIAALRSLVTAPPAGTPP
jgi:teichuronic acid biosynthesis glycosyltransferase TuaC